MNPSIQALEWIPRVTYSERMSYETEAWLNGLTDFRITERDGQGNILRAGERAEYFPVYFVEPCKGNEIALGYDIASSPIRKKALDSSRDTGEMVATGRVSLVQETASQFGFLVFAPIFTKSVTYDSLDARRENLKGFALGVFRIGDIVEKALKHIKSEGIEICLYDKSADAREGSFLYFHPSRPGISRSSSTPDEAAVPDGDLKNIRRLNIANREWLILMKAAPDFVSSGKTWQPLGVLTAGLLLTAILTSYLVLRKHAEDAVRESERHYRSLFENMLDGFAFCRMLFERNQPADYIYLDVNRAFETLTGLKDVVGKKVTEVIPGIEESSPELLEIFGKAALTGNPVQFEKYVPTIGKWLSIAVYSPQREHFVTIIENVTERKKAEKEVRRLNRLYDVLSQVNQAIVRIGSRDELFSTVCRLIVERSAIDLAWIGWLNPETSAINPVAHFGDHARMLTEAHFYANESPERQGNPGMAVREGRSFVCNECRPGFCLCLARLAPASFGFKSCGSFPIRFGGEVCGALTLCIAEQGFFHEREIQLLNEVALDVSYALDKIESDGQRDCLREEYQQQSVFLRTLMDAMPYQVFYKDTQMRYLGCNRAFEAANGLRKDQIIGRTVHEIKTPELADLHHEAERRLLANPDQQNVVYEETSKAADNTPKYLQVTKALFRSQDGALGGIIGATVDITGLKNTEQALRESEKRLSMALSASRMGVWEWDAGTNSIYWSPECHNVFGVKNFDGKLETFKNLFHPEDLAGALVKIRNAIKGGTVYEDEFRTTDTGGETRWVSASGMAEYGHDGKPLILRGTAQDITRQKQLEKERELVDAQLRQAQKLESIGQLAAGIAHEINTPTQYIGDNTRFLREAFNDLVRMMDRYAEAPEAIMAGGPLDEVILKMKEAAEQADVEYLRDEIPKAIEQALDGVQRVSTIVQAMKAFSHPGSTEKMLTDINSAIETTITVARNEWKYVADVLTDFDPALPPVPCLPGEFNQVILNMIINSAHAIAEKVGDGSSQKGAINISTKERGNFVEICIRDNGNGVREDIKSKIFDPFFTTKEVGKGTGQGLAISHSVIVKKHGGTIDFESKSGEGTTFIIRLPI
jgi:PAS domain S-box-containing protein